jgi:Tetracyclin repressor-like, C-terminal domain
MNHLSLSHLTVLEVGPPDLVTVGAGRRLFVARVRQAEDVFRADADPIDVHMTIAARGTPNVTNHYTLGMLFRRPMGAQRHANRRRAMTAAIVLRWRPARQRLSSTRRTTWSSGSTVVRC